MGGALCRRCVGVPRWGFVCGAANFMPEFYSSAEIFPYLCAGVSPGANLPESFCKTPLTESRRRCRITCKSRLLKPSLGGWLSGRALRSHRRGHRFESCTAHCFLLPPLISILFPPRNNLLVSVFTALFSLDYVFFKPESAIPNEMKRRPSPP